MRPPTNLSQLRRDARTLVEVLARAFRWKRMLE